MNQSVPAYKNNQLRLSLKNLFRGYRVMNASLRHGLMKLGFSVLNSKTHYKVFFRDNPYPIVLAKTTSDHRCGLNFVRDAMLIVGRTHAN